MAEWSEFYALEPFGWEAQCYAAGIVAATLANIHRDPKKKAKPFSAADFIPGATPPKKDPRLLKPEMAMLVAQMKAITHGRKGGVHDKGRP
jgi:hypothetical protein